MNIELINEMGTAYIRIPFCSEGEDNRFDAITLSDYDYNMMESADISGIAKVNKRIIDGKAYLFVPISTYMPLTQKMLGKSLNVEMFRDFFRQLLVTYENMKSYLLDENMIFLDPDYIYYDTEKNKYIFLPISIGGQSIHDRYDKLFTFFIDWCDLEEKELLGFIFEIYSLLEEQKWESSDLVKYILDYKFAEKKMVMFEKECELFEEEILDVEKEDEDKEIEKSKIIGVFTISIILLVLAFYLSYMIAYDFKYMVISVVASFLAVGLMAFQVYRISKVVLIKKCV